MIKELIKLATHLDSEGLKKEADYLDAIIKKIALDIDPFMPLDAWKFNPDDNLGKALLDCSLRESYGGITCRGWKDLEGKAKKQAPNADIKTNCLCKDKKK